MEQVDSRQAKSKATLDKLFAVGALYLDDYHGNIAAAQAEIIRVFDKACVSKKQVISNSQLPIVHEMLALSVVLAAEQKNTARTGETAADSTKFDDGDSIRAKA